MKLNPMVKVLIVFMTISVFSMFAFSVSQEETAKQKEKYGQIEVTSAVQDATIYIEGFNVGSTPLELQNVPPGHYRVIVKAKGYDDFLQDVTVEKQKVSKVDARMAEGDEGSKALVCDYSYWKPLSENEIKILKKAKCKTRLRKYRNLEVANFEVKSENNVLPKFLFGIYSNLIRQFDENMHFKQIITNYTNIEGIEGKKVYPPEKADTVGETLVLSGVITKFKKGSQAARYFVGFGAGKTQITILYRLTDKKSGEVVFEKLISGSVSWGLFGGKSKRASKSVGKKYVNILMKAW